MMTPNDTQSEQKCPPTQETEMGEAMGHPGGKKPQQDEPVQGIPLYQGDGEDREELKRFVVQGYQDVWAAVSYLLCFIIIVCVGICNVIMHHSSEEESSNSTSTGESSGRGASWSVYSLVSVAAAVSMLMASLSFALMRKFPHTTITVANIAALVINFIAALLTIVSRNVGSGILLLTLCGLHALWFYFARCRIPFAAELLKASVDVLSSYKAVYFFNILLCVVSTAILILWANAFLFACGKTTGNEPSPTSGLLLLFLMLFLFWTSQVTTNLMHVTTAGLTATWYFAGKENMPKNPTLASFKRGTTTSFGSICLGSLLVAIIRLIRWLVSTAEGSDHETLRCIFLFIVNWLERLMEYFNTYAFVHVAMYGCGYFDAAKMTWELCKQCVFSAYFNDTLIDVTLVLLATAGSFLVGSIFGIIYTSWLVFAIASAVSSLVHLLIFSPVGSAVTTLFVCFAEVPEGLEHSSPDLYAALQRADQNGTSNDAPPPRV